MDVKGEVQMTNNNQTCCELVCGCQVVITPAQKGANLNVVRLCLQAQSLDGRARDMHIVHQTHPDFKPTE